MSNTSNKKAEKGSKYWMQEIVNNDSLKEELGRRLGRESLKWISPLANDSYDEYQLTENKLKQEIPELENMDFSFWPKRGPEWDAIALSEDRSELYLFEAKSYKNEMRKGMGATDKDSIYKIKESMKKTCEEFYENVYDEKIWEGKYYQLGNRLTFLYNMNHEEKLPKVKLVLLNIVYDITHDDSKRTQLEEWKKHYEEVFEKMTGSKETPKDVIMLYFHCGFC